MSKRRTTISFALILFIVAQNAAVKSFAQDKKLSHLMKHLDTYHYEEVIKDPFVTKKLKALLKDEYQHLETNLTVHAPIGLSSDCLVLGGLAPHKGGQEEARLYVCLTQGDIHAAIYTNHRVRVYSKVERYSHLPYDLRVWVDHVAWRQQSPLMSGKPDFVDMDDFETEK
ncbi:MAG: hypothetical protein KDI46_02615 [Alphaproteobacteria bacterium]|nr:hypothetical protein [Alphaproteobacteria bacterium]